MFLINLNAEIVACILFRKLRHKPNLENTSKYGFSPDLGGGGGGGGGEKGGVLSMRMQVILDSFFRPPGLSPYMGREERRVQGLDYYASYFQPSSRCFNFPMKHCLSCLIYITYASELLSPKKSIASVFVRGERSGKCHAVCLQVLITTNFIPNYQRRVGLAAVFHF